MGATVHANCACGFESRYLRIGGGMRSFKTFCAFPVYCRSCATLQTPNLLALPVTCGVCRGEEVTAYDDPSLIGEAGAEEVVTWNASGRLGRVLKLTNGTYFCPACRQHTLRFTPGGLKWD